MPTNRRLLRRSRRTTITSTQEMELWLGPGHNGSAFRSDEERRALWFRYRDRLMQRWGKEGRRPQAWWAYEAPEKGLRRYPGSAHERSILYETAGVLSEEERIKLEQWWRREFDRSWEPHFFYCAGPDKIFSGDAARWQHWLFVDLPPELLDKWLAERQRRGQVIRELEEESPPALAEAIGK